MKKNRKSAFARWFKEQFGALPDLRKRDTALDRVAQLEEQLHEARMTVRVQNNLQDAWTHALYGWNAARTDRRDDGEAKR